MNLSTPLLLGLTVAALMGCATTPKYYSTQHDSLKIPCFTSPPSKSYQWVLLDRVKVRDAFTRINGIFAGPHGIYRWLFDPQWTADDFKQRNFQKCDEASKREMLAARSYMSSRELNVHISAFAQPVAPKQDSAPKSGTGNGQNAPEGKPLQKSAELVISSYLYSLVPADRLEKVYTIITPLEPGVEFMEARGPAVPATVEFGTVKTTTGLGLTPTGFPLGTTQGQIVAIQPHISRELERKVARRFATQNVEIFPLRNALLISEDGGPAGADIGGNSITNIVVSIPTSLCTYLSVVQRGSQTVTPYCYIERVSAVMAAVGVVRVVESGETTVEEDDDVITLRPFKSVAPFDLWRNPPLYGLDLGEAAVVIMDAHGVRDRLLFEHLEDALKFREWFLSDTLGKSPSDLAEKGVEWNKVKIGLQKSISFVRNLQDALKICRFSTVRATPEQGRVLSEASVPEPVDLCASSG